MAKRPIRKALYPLPVDALFHHPAYIALTPAGRGMLLSLCEHYWRTHCRPLPRDDNQLFAIARAHRPTWRHHRDEILGIFAAIEPELAAYFRRREGGRIGMAQIMEIARAARASKRAQALIAEASPTPQPALAHVPPPILEPGRRAVDVATDRTPQPASAPERPRLRA